MTENEKRIEHLILKYARHEPLTGEEMAILQEWRGRSAEHDALPEKFRDEKWVEESLTRLSRIPSEQIWQRISEQVEKEKRLITPWYIKAGAAAGIALIVVAVGVLIPNRSAVKKDGGAQVASIPATATVREQVFSNPTGVADSVFRTLPDGSRVKLNSGSSIYFSTALAGKERRVRIEGEADFKVVKDPDHPFIVQLPDGGYTQDLSTEFNIMAYPGEGIAKVTLIEGAIKVNNGKSEVELNQPLQQVQLTTEKIGAIKKLASEDDAIAWQKGKFHFEDTDLRTAMQELSRCYGKKIKYEDDDVKGAPLHRLNMPRQMSWELTLGQVMDQEKGFATFSEKGDTLYIGHVTKGK